LKTEGGPSFDLSFLTGGCPVDALLLLQGATLGLYS